MANKKRSTNAGGKKGGTVRGNSKGRSTNNRNKRRSSKKNGDKYGILLLGIGILMLMGLLSQSIEGISMGAFGEYAYKFLTTMFGVGAFIIPFLITAVGCMYIANKGKVRYTSRFYGIIIVLICILVLLNIFNYDKFYDPPNMMTAFEKIKELTSVFHGGMISFLIAVPLCALFGKTGGIIVVFIGLAIGGICITELELNYVIRALKEHFQIRREERRERERDEVMPGRENRQNKSRGKGSGGEEIAVTNSRCKFQRDEDRVKIVDFLKSNTVEERRNEPQEKHLSRKSIEEEIKRNTIKEESEIPEIVESSMYKNKTEVSKPVREEKMVSGDKVEEKITIPEGLKEEEKLQEHVENETCENTPEVIHGEFQEHEEKHYVFPHIDFLKVNKDSVWSNSDNVELVKASEKLTETLKSFGVKARVLQVTKGPSVTRFEIQPEIGVKVSKIVNLSDDIALNLAASSIRIEAPIPGKAAVGIEVPNKKLVPVLFREIIESDAFEKSKGKLTTGLGKDISGKAITADLSKMPHVLVAGATGSGKSVCINSLIISLLYKYSPEDVKLLMIDPKVVELNVYNGIPHLLIPVVTDCRKAAGALGWAVGEMERRYKAFADNGTKNIDGYNELHERGIIEEKMPYIVIIIDELADLMMVAPKDVEGYIARLAQMARAAGMHLVIATQRPSVDVITGMIKANIPSRIAFAVSSQVDSRTIIDSSGAEKLLGKGDMLFMPIGKSKPVRIQGAFISESEVEEIVNFIKIDKGGDKYEEDIIEAIDNGGGAGGSDDGADPLLAEAIEFVIQKQKASTSMVQRKFKIGYNRAARIIEEMEDRGIVSGPNGSKPRQILVDSPEAL